MEENHKHVLPPLYFVFSSVHCTVLMVSLYSTDGILPSAEDLHYGNNEYPPLL